jgi:hypothetical protein
MAHKIQTSDGVTFGEKLTYSSLKTADYSLSDDRKAFEIRFNPGLAAGVGTPVYDGLHATHAPINTRVYSAVIPATGNNLNTSFVLNGFGMTEAGTNATLVLTVNDQHSVTHFGADREEGAFTATLPYRAEVASDLRLTVVLIAERDAAHPDASALIAITDISADTAFTP